MRGHHELLRRLQQEPNREFSTSDLVECLYPHEWKAIRANLAHGDNRTQRVAQTEKTKLHRKALYHIGQLVSQGILSVVRLDSHGEKCYQVRAESATVRSPLGPYVIERTELALPMLAEDLTERRCQLFDSQSTLARFESCYIHGAQFSGIGQLLQYTEYTLRATSDVVAIGGLEPILSKYRQEDLREFIHALSLQTLDEGKTVVCLLEMRSSAERILALTIAELQPPRVQVILNAAAATLRDPAVQEVIEVYCGRYAKLTVTATPPQSPPLFVGRAGPYIVPLDAWKRLLSGEIPVAVVSRASISIDFARIRTMQALAFSEFTQRVTKALFSIAAQQRLAKTGLYALGQCTPTPARAIEHGALIVRIWNYDWQEPPATLALLQPTARDALAEHSRVYRACGVPLTPSVQCSTAFAKYSPELSARAYRKWTISSEADLHSPEFTAYRDARARITASLQGQDRLRIFRSGNPTSAQIATEFAWLLAAGFSLITYEFKAIAGVRTLTEYFGGSR